MIDPREVHEGMIVRSAEGTTLGRVLSCEEREFTVGKGFVFVADYLAHYEDVTHVSGEEIQLSQSQEELAPFEHGQGLSEPEVEPATYGDEGGAGRA